MMENKKANLMTIDLGGLDSKIEVVDILFESKEELENPKSVAYTLNWQLSKKRIGSANTKTMSEISGTTAKPHKQKGTGHARQGSKRSVQFRGGRTCFGPRARSFSYSLPKKIINIALSDVIKLKIKENKLILFSGYCPGIKTSEMSKVLKSNNIADKSLIICPSNDYKNLRKSAGNIKNVKILDFKGLNVYDILDSEQLIVDINLFQIIKKVAFNELY
jgi:large subunit ribosomal protein L4